MVWTVDSWSWAAPLAFDGFVAASSLCIWPRAVELGAYYGLWPWRVIDTGFQCMKMCTLCKRPSSMNAGT